MPKKRTIELGSGRSLHVHQEGAGQDLVLIHGAMTTSHDWIASPVFSELTKSSRVSVIDRPGHGRSQRRRFGTPREQADQIADGLGKLGIRRAVVAAHSYGSLVAIALAERHPKLVTGMVLVAPLAYPEPRPIEHLMLAPRSIPVLGPLLARFAEFTQLDRPMVDLLHHLMFAPAKVPIEWQATYPYAMILNARAIVSEAEDAASMMPMSPFGTFDMRQIMTPARVITGTSDRAVEDERQAKMLARQLPFGSLVEVKGAGHMLHHSHADLVIRSLRAAMAHPEPTRLAQ